MTATKLGSSSNPFDMLQPGSPEFSALGRLAKDGLIKEHAIILAKGQPITRYQAAVVAAEAINNAETLIRQGKTSTLSAADVNDLQVVYADFRNDLAALSARVTAVEKAQAEMHEEMTSLRSSVQSAAAPGSTSVAAGGKPPSFEIHGEFRVRPVQALNQSASGIVGFAGPGLPAGTTMTRTGTSGDAVGIGLGDNGFGGLNSRMRLVGLGHIGDTGTFIVRLSTEDTGGGNNASLVHNDFSFFEYAVPKMPWTFYGGKLLYCCNTPWLPDGTGLIADAVPIGVAAKWTDPSKSPTKLSAWASAGSLKNAQTGQTFIPSSPNNIGFTQNIWMGHVEGNVGPMTKLQAQMLGTPAQTVTEFRNGALRTNLANITLGSITATHQFTPMLSASVEGAARFGNNPTTGGRWDDNGAIYAAVNYGPSGQQWRGNGRLLYAGTGKNSLINGLDSILNGVDGLWNFQLPYATNVRVWEAGYSWFFAPTGHIDLNYGHSSLGVPEFTAEGNSLTRDDRNLFVLQTVFGF